MVVSEEGYAKCYKQEVITAFPLTDAMCPTMCRSLGGAAMHDKCSATCCTNKMSTCSRAGTLL